MIYPYECTECAFQWEVIKPVRAIDDPETCAKCSGVGHRYIGRTHFYGAKVEDAYFNKGLGCVVNSSAHLKQIAKERGLVEIGNESAESCHKFYDKAREQKYEQGWVDIDKQVARDGI